MAEFKAGDKVRRKLQYSDTTEWNYGLAVCTVVACCENSVRVEEDSARRLWDLTYFELVSEKENDVSNEVEKQVPGVPDGYRLIRIGAPKKGEYFVIGWREVQQADENMYEYCWPVVEPIKPVEPPQPETEDVVLNRYLVSSNDGNDGGHWMLVVCTAEYADTFFSNYKLIGPSETVTIEVE